MGIGFIQSSCTNLVFYILQECVKLKVPIYDQLTLLSTIIHSNLPNIMDA